MDKRRLLLILLISFAGALSLHEIEQGIRVSIPISSKVTESAKAVPAIARSLRPNYPYSVIAGGAYSPAELRFANQQDSLVRQHYAGFDLQSAHLVTLSASRYQYVSFRQNNRIYWTRQRILIPKGETLLTDGNQYARTRCGNRLSNQPSNDVSPAQPPERALTLPPFSPALLKQGSLQFAPAPPIGELAQEHPDLPFDLPHLTPYLPPSTAIFEAPSTPFAGASPFGPGISAGAPIAIPGGAPLPTVPGVFAPPGGGGSVSPPSLSFSSTPPAVSEVPEPAPLGLALLVLAISSGALAGISARNGRKVSTAFGHSK